MRYINLRFAYLLTYLLTKLYLSLGPFRKKCLGLNVKKHQLEIHVGPMLRILLELNKGQKPLHQFPRSLLTASP